MENKKLLLGVILFGWTVLTILILTFAMPVSKKIQRKIIAAVRKNVILKLLNWKMSMLIYVKCIYLIKDMW